MNNRSEVGNYGGPPPERGSTWLRATIARPPDRGRTPAPTITRPTETPPQTPLITQEELKKLIFTDSPEGKAKKGRRNRILLIASGVGGALALTVAGGTAWAVKSHSDNNDSPNPQSRSADSFPNGSNDTRLVDDRVVPRAEANKDEVLYNNLSVEQIGSISDDHIAIKAGENGIPATPATIKKIIESAPEPIEKNKLPTVNMILPMKLGNNTNVKADTMFYDTAFNPTTRRTERIANGRKINTSKDVDISYPIIPGMTQVEMFVMEPIKEGDAFEGVVFKVTMEDGAAHGLFLNGLNSRSASIQPNILNNTPVLPRYRKIRLLEENGLVIPITEIPPTIFTSKNHAMGINAATYNQDYPEGLPARIEALTNGNHPLYLPK